MTQHKLTDAMASSDPKTKMWKSRFAAAKAAYSVGDFRQCESLLFRAMAQAKTLTEWTFATNTCHVGLGALYLATGKHDRAREQLETAMNALSGSGEPALRELYAVALRFQGQLLIEAGDYAEAENQLQAAIQTLEGLGTDGGVQLAYTLSDLATLYVIQGNLKDAKELVFSAMDILEAALGPGNPEYARASMIYNVTEAKGEEQLLSEVEDSIFRMQYQHGYKHPNITRALRRYLKKRQERGESDKIAEAKERFDLHSKALGS